MTGSPIPADHERFALDDGAYVLDALAPAERFAFEEHLSRCGLCRRSVEELAGLSELLGQADEAGLRTEPPPTTLLPRLLAEAGRQRSRRSWRTAAIGFAVACALALLVTGGVRWYDAAHAPRALALHAVGPQAGDVHATVRLLGSAQDPRIQLDCGYHSAGSAYPNATIAPAYSMVVYNRSGLTRNLGSWTPQPGEDVQITRQSPWPKQALARIEITDAQGQVLLQLSL